MNARHRVEHRHGAVEHAQAALHFRREIDVTWGVDDVDGDVAPFAGGGSGSNSDAALLLLLHPVHDGRAFMHFADFVSSAGVVQDAFRSCSLTGIDVGHDADIPHFVHWHGTHIKPGCGLWEVGCGTYFLPPTSYHL